MGNTFSVTNFPWTFLCTLLLARELRLKNPLTRPLLPLVVVLINVPRTLTVPLTLLVGTLLTAGVFFLGPYEHPPTNSMLTSVPKFGLAVTGHRTGMIPELQVLPSRLRTPLQLYPLPLSRPIRKTIGPPSPLAQWKRPRALILMLHRLPRRTTVALAIPSVAIASFMKLLDFG